MCRVYKMDNTFTYIIIIIIIIYFLNKTTIEGFSSSSEVCNDIDGHCYSVSNKYSNRQEASDKLAFANLFMVSVIRHLRDNVLWGNCSQYRRNMIEYLLNNYRPDKIIENVPIGDVNTSYVDDKGIEFGICLREKESGENKIHDNNILEFVLLHEISHLGSFEYTHDQEFWTNFKIIISEAVKAGLHTPVNYKIHPIRYCSLLVDYNPYFDDNIPSK